jgi:hypothetical protein
MEKFEKSSSGAIFACSDVGSIERCVNCANVNNCFSDCVLLCGKSFSTEL